MSKYIVKSCPNLATSYYAEGDIIHNQCGLTDDDSLCQDCTDCKLKQIVELCKDYYKNCEIEGNCIDDRTCTSCFFGGGNELAQDILSNLDIQECE